MPEEWVKCALTGMKDENMTWCGRTPMAEFTFTDASHAALNAKKEGRLVLCRECALAIIGVLKAQHGW